MLKNITLSAEESAIAAARERARRGNTTLNQKFREWLKQYGDKDDADEKAMKEAEGKARVKAFRECMARIGTFSVSPIPSREERNARR